MDFMSDALFDGRSFRLLTIVDCHPREPFAIVPRANFKAFHVVDALDRLATEHSKPRTVRCDTGPEFACRMLDQWAYLNGIEIEFYKTHSGALNHRRSLGLILRCFRIRKSEPVNWNDQIT